MEVLADASVREADQFAPSSVLDLNFIHASACSDARVLVEILPKKDRDMCKVPVLKGFNWPFLYKGVIENRCKYKQCRGACQQDFTPGSGQGTTFGVS